MREVEEEDGLEEAEKDEDEDEEDGKGRSLDA